MIQHSSFAGWASDPDGALLTLTAPSGYAGRAHDLTVNPLPTLSLDVVQAPKHISGRGVRCWAPDGEPLTWVGSDGPGPSNTGMVRWDGLHLRDAGVEFHNLNFGKIHDLSVFNAPTAFKVLNRNSGGQSEHNELLGARIWNCDEGIVLGGGTGNPSHRGWDMRAVITGTPKPFTVGPTANVYGGQFRLHISTKNGLANPNAAVCLDGNIHGAHFDILIENECQIGIALADKRTQGISTQTQGYIRAHFVHEVTHPAIFDGPMADLPAYRFTYGNPANGNRLRPAWVCADGEVFESSRI